MPAVHVQLSTKYFYPRSPCGERHFTGYVCRLLEKHFYPRSPCGERLPPHSDPLGLADISIHALLAESDLMPSQAWLQFPVFLSTLSLRRATYIPRAVDTSSFHFYPRSPCGERPLKFCQFEVIIVISIHALLAESDFIWQAIHNVSRIFLSTLSLRRATKYGVIPQQCGLISIHALLAESDL